MNERPILITGGAGFIGTNTAYHYLRAGHPVHLVDNLSRQGVSDNYHWLKSRFGDRVRLSEWDVRDYKAIESAIAGVSAVCHFAAQVAVTTSLVQPLDDFEVNARGTLNVLEAIRNRRDVTGEVVPLIFTSTNKVYGGLDDIGLHQVANRYQPSDMAVARWGVNEERPLNFHSPYGCSKGAADQYVLDYARTYALPFTVFRMSCIYGPHQKGNEDQGWVAHFLIQALKDEQINIFGDGCQVRDVLFAEDLVAAFQLALGHPERVAGRAFNLGGGPDNQVSLREVLERISEVHGRRPECRYGPWRPSDQRYYVSDTRAYREAVGWSPRVSAAEGIARLYDWLQKSDTEADALAAA